jgi:predicted component of type VI protein secretion system
VPELHLTVAALDYVFPAPYCAGIIGESGGTLGRDARNTFVLADEQHRRVSRLHAEITFVRGVPILSNRSTSLDVQVGEQALEPGESAIVQDEDLIEIGPYLLYASVINPQPPESSLNVTHGPSVAPPVTAESLRRAFLDGAQLPHDAFNAEFGPELMALIGSMLRVGTQGTMELLAARDITQREIRVGSSLVSEQSNNPLRYLPASEAALVQMITGNLPGFMHGTHALPDAFADLLAHEAGVIAGMRGTLNEMLARLDPRQLDAALRDVSEQRVHVAASVDKARWWDTQNARFAREMTLTEDDFHLAWGGVFVAAYTHAAAVARDQALAQTQVNALPVTRYPPIDTTSPEPCPAW